MAGLQRPYHGLPAVSMEERRGILPLHLYALHSSRCACCWHVGRRHPIGYYPTLDVQPKECLKLALSRHEAGVYIPRRAFRETIGLHGGLSN